MCHIINWGSVWPSNKSCFLSSLLKAVQGKYYLLFISSHLAFLLVTSELLGCYWRGLYKYAYSVGASKSKKPGLNSVIRIGCQSLNKIELCSALQTPFLSTHELKCTYFKRKVQILLLILDSDPSMELPS